MAIAPFDAADAVKFDLAQGLIQLDDETPRLLVPAAALVQLCDAAGPEATAALGRAMGESIGQRVTKRFKKHGDDARGASVESVIDQLGGELSIAGLGALSSERWGKALV